MSLKTQKTHFVYVNSLLSTSYLWLTATEKLKKNSSLLRTECPLRVIRLGCLPIRQGYCAIRAGYWKTGKRWGCGHAFGVLFKQTGSPLQADYPRGTGRPPVRLEGTSILIYP